MRGCDGLGMLGYRALWAGGLLLGAPYLAGRALARGREMRERRGDWEPLPPPAIGAPWVHAASVGETRAALPLLGALSARGHAPCFSMITPSARALEREVLGRGACAARYAPLDFPPFVRRVLRRVRPGALLILETEIWPTLLSEARRQGVPVAFVSARLTERGARRSARIGFLLRRSLAGVRVCAQSEADAGRWAALGVAPQSIQVTGNTKYEAPRGRLPEDERVRQRQGWRHVVVLGSVRSAELGELTAALRATRAAVGGATLWVIAPRHPRSARAQVQRILGAQMPLRTREQPADALLPAPDHAAGHSGLLVTTIGELRRFYAIADLAFVGGTLCPIGGHSLYEAAELGVPVLWGPHTANVADVAARLREGGGGREAESAGALGQAMVAWLNDAAARARAGEAALRAAKELGGAVPRTLAALRAWGLRL